MIQGSIARPFPRRVGRAVIRPCRAQFVSAVLRHCHLAEVVRQLVQVELQFGALHRLTVASDGGLEG